MKKVIMWNDMRGKIRVANYTNSHFYNNKLKYGNS